MNTQQHQYGAAAGRSAQCSVGAVLNDVGAGLIMHERWFNIYRHTVTGPFPDQATADRYAELGAQPPEPTRRIGPARRIVFTPVGYID